MLADGYQLAEGTSITNLVLTNVTEIQKLALPTPSIGEIVYQTNNNNGVYVYTGTEWVKTATGSGNLTLPAFTGDIVSDVGSNVLRLSNITTAGTYTKVTVDAKGRIYSGLSPTLIAGLGITDVYTKTEIDTQMRVTSINGKKGVISKLAPTDISGLSASATTDTTNAANISTGVLSPARMPVFTGDLLNSRDDTSVVLRSITSSGTYNKVSVNSKGLVTSGSVETTLAGLGITDGVSSSMLPSGNATTSQLVRGNDTRLNDARPPTAHTHYATDVVDLSSLIIDSISTAIQNNNDALRNGVSSNGDTLRKLYDLITAGTIQIPVPNIAARDELNITSMSVTVFVENDTNGAWAVYKPTSLGINANYMKLTDKASLTTATGTSVEIVANKDTDGTFSMNSDIRYPSQRAVKTYIDNRIRAAGPQTTGAIASSVHSINGYTPDLTGDVVLPNVLSINGYSPNVNGYVSIPIIESINGLSPDINGDITLSSILAINGFVPDGTGSINFDYISSINGRTGTISKILPGDTSGIFNSSTGKVLSSLMPAFSGDATSNPGTTTLTLKDMPNLSAGIYNAVSVDTKGRVVAGQFVNYVTSDASTLQSGTISGERLPAFYGDITTDGSTAELRLTPVPNLTPGTYNSVSVDNKGRVTQGGVLDTLPVTVVRRGRPNVSYNIPIGNLAGYDSLPLIVRRRNGSIMNYTVPTNL
jgi:hypothetical protein